MTRPSLDALRRIDEDLPRLNRAQRVAFAAGSVERILPVIRDHFGDPGIFEEAVDLCWRFATGEELDPTSVAKLDSLIEAELDELYSAGEAGALLNAVKAVLIALRSTQQLEARVPADAAMNAAEVAEGNLGGAKGQEQIAEERQWQLRALDIVFATIAPTRSMFSSIAAEPSWLKPYLSTR